MNYIFVKFFSFGAPGLVIATVIVNLLSMVALLWILNRRLNGLNLRSWILPILSLTGASILAGLSSWWILQGIPILWGKQGFLGVLLELSFSGLAGLVLFGVVAARLKVPEFKLFISRIKKRLPTALKR